MQLGKYDVMPLTETKTLDAVYCNNPLGYDVVFLRLTPTPDVGVQKGVGLVIKYRP